MRYLYYDANSQEFIIVYDYYCHSRVMLIMLGKKILQTIDIPESFLVLLKILLVSANLQILRPIETEELTDLKSWLKQSI